MSNEVHQAIEKLAEALTDVCATALREHGVIVAYGGNTYDALWQVMHDIATPKARS